MGTSKAVSLGLPLLKQLKQLLTSLGLRNSQIIKCKEKISFNPFHDFHEPNFQDKKLPGFLPGHRRFAMGSGGSVPKGEEFPEPEALKREEYVTEHHKPLGDDTRCV